MGCESCLGKDLPDRPVCRRVEGLFRLRPTDRLCALAPVVAVGLGNLRPDPSGIGWADRPIVALANREEGRMDRSQDGCGSANQAKRGRAGLRCVRVLRESHAADAYGREGLGLQCPPIGTEEWRCRPALGYLIFPSVGSMV